MPMIAADFPGCISSEIEVPLSLLSTEELSIAPDMPPPEFDPDEEALSSKECVPSALSVIFKPVYWDT
ncbi:MAG: hypothetical protein AB9903_34955 [Vulcanimicrobiota bacterium]